MKYVNQSSFQERIMPNPEGPEEVRSQSPGTAAVTWITFEGSLEDDSTLADIFYYIESASNCPVNICVQGRIMSVIPGADKAWLQRRHQEIGNRAVLEFLGIEDRRKRDLGHAPTPLEHPKEPK